MHLAALLAQNLVCFTTLLAVCIFRGILLLGKAKFYIRPMFSTPLLV